MEASQAGLAQGGQGEGGEGQAQQQQGPDLSALVERLDQMAGSQEQMREYLQSNPWQPQEAQEEQQQGDPEFDLSFLDNGEPEYDDPRVVAERLGQQFQQQLQQGIQQAVTPLQQQQTEMRHRMEAQALVDEFPQIADPDTAQQVVQAARQLAEDLGQPQLGDEPKMWRLAFMTLAAQEAAQNEGADDPSAQAAHLEGAGGAGPAAPQVDLGDQIVSGSADGERLGRRALPFQ